MSLLVLSNVLLSQLACIEKDKSSDGTSKDKHEDSRPDDTAPDSDDTSSDLAPPVVAAEIAVTPAAVSDEEGGAVELLLRIEGGASDYVGQSFTVGLSSGASLDAVVTAPAEDRLAITATVPPGQAVDGARLDAELRMNGAAFGVSSISI